MMSEQAEHPGNVMYIALGSNIADRESWLRQAITKLSQLEDVHGLRLSSIYETDPVGYTDQDAFLNMVVALETKMTVRTMFQHMTEIEQQLGRQRDVHWGPRTIDLDLLMVDDLTTCIDEPDLIVPHPRMLERAFVLTPLLDVLDRQHPDFAELTQIAQQLPNQEGVEVWKSTLQLQDALERFAN